MGNVSGRGGRRRRRAAGLTVEGPRPAPAAQVCFTGAPIEYGNEDNLTDIEKKLKHQFRNRGRDHQHPMDGLGVLTRNIQTIANANNTIRDVFTTYDKDEDGSINLEEFGEALDSLGLTVSKDLRDDVLQEAEFQPGKGMDQSEFLIYIALLVRARPPTRPRPAPPPRPPATDSGFSSSPRPSPLRSTCCRATTRWTPTSARPLGSPSTRSCPRSRIRHSV